jgi:hypothetical protein
MLFDLGSVRGSWRVCQLLRGSASGWVSAPSFCFHLSRSDGVFGRFDLAALRGCHTLNVCLLLLPDLLAGRAGLFYHA